MRPKGFTLIELLVVIAILAVLAVAVILVLNPAELIRQARDTTRISDLAAVNSAIALFLADVSNPTWPSAVMRCTDGTESLGGTSCTQVTSTAVSSSGWVSLDFTGISGGSPIPRLPIDPINDSDSTNCAGSPDGCYYAFQTSATTGKYKLFANMESTKYGTTAASNVELDTKDGGNVDTWYEVGSDMSL